MTGDPIPLVVAPVIFKTCHKLRGLPHLLLMRCRPARAVLSAPDVGDLGLGSQGGSCR